MIVGQHSNYAMIYRPQHFIGHEMPLTVARMMILGQTCGAAETKNRRRRRCGKTALGAWNSAGRRRGLHGVRTYRVSRSCPHGTSRLDGTDSGR